MRASDASVELRCAGSATPRASFTLSSISAIASGTLPGAVVREPEVLRAQADRALVAELARDARSTSA